MKHLVSALSPALLPLLASALAVATLVACAGDRPDTLSQALRAGGPKVVWDIEARPFPEVPFPNDAATRLVDDSPTGRRLNLSTEANTEAERRFRRRLNKLDGFALLGAMTVSFDAPIDFVDLDRRHNDDADPTNDGILLVRLGEGDSCSTPSRLIPIDVGGGHYPVVLDRPCQYNFNPWEGDFICEPVECTVGDDPRAGESNLVFETVAEDLNGNGRLDPYEDTDFDGHLDQPNTWTGEPSAEADDLVTFWEKETNTLIAWPVRPLDEGTRYAVVLTKNLTDEQGRAVEPPFEGIAPARQTGAVRQLEEILPCHGLSMDDVAFTWVFTTGTPTRELLAIRDGLYGAGPLGAALGGRIGADTMRADRARDVDPDTGAEPPSPHVLPSEILLPIVQPLAGQILETPGAGTNVTADMAAVDYWVHGDFLTPYLMVDKDGRATEKYPDDQDEVFDIDLEAGHVRWDPARVPFICSIPKTTEQHKPPFPVVIYAHGYSGATFEVLGFAGRFAKAGFAFCGIEAPGHGLVIPGDETQLLALLDLALDAFGLRAFYDAYAVGRVRDLDHDGLISDRDNGTDFWTADIFHTRDMLRQLIIDHLQFIRTLRAIDGRLTMETDTDGDGKPNPQADFNGDGVPDMGGFRDLDGDGVRGADEPDSPIYVMGQSLGGITSAILAGVEPAVRAAAPISTAGGLVQVGIRSTNAGVPDAILLPILGPFIAFAPHTDDEGVADGRVDVGFLVAKVNQPVRPVFHSSSAIRPGDRVIVENLTSGARAEAFANEGLRFRVGIASDALRLGERRAHLGLSDGSPLPVTVTRAQALGLGDRLRITILDGWDGRPKEVIEQTSLPFEYGGVRYPAGSPIVALAEGLGYSRNSPDLRRVLSVSQIAVEPGDPVVYARFIKDQPRAYPYETGDVKAARDAGERTRYLQYHTVGDSDVPMAAGLTLARAAGVLDDEQMAVLIDHHVAEGVERMLRYPQRKEYSGFCPHQIPTTEWTCPAVRLGEETRYADFFQSEPTTSDLCGGGCDEGSACFYDGLCVPTDGTCAPMPEAPIEGVHFDIMDLDEGTDRLILPEYNLDPPLRPTLNEPDGVFALRIPYLTRKGSHGVPPSIPERAFDVNGFVINQILWFFARDGRELSDAPCLANGDCEFLGLTP